jgi:phospholipid/cholesterol/gamma-HCH transport system substrate-binding protein
MTVMLSFRDVGHPDFFEGFSCDIAKTVKPLLVEVRGIVDYINNPDGDVRKAIRNTEQLTRNLEETRRNADKLLITATGNVNQISARTNSLLDSTRSRIERTDLAPTITRVNTTLDRIDGKLPSLLEKTDATLENINRISYETRLLSEQTFPRIPGVISQAEDVLLSTDNLINSLQNSWLLRSSTAPAAKRAFISGDSHE